MENPSHFIIIDDDTINNTLCSVIIKRVLTNAGIQTFTAPEKGFEHIAEGSFPDEKPIVLFLDINMPGWSGWVFLENFERLNENLKKKFKIYMLSSSVDPHDKEKAKISKSVVDFVVKPLTKEKLISLLT